MRKVEFEEVTSEICGYGIKGVKIRFNGIQEIIQERIENGWEYSGFFPVVMRGAGEIETMSLVFEKEDLDE